MSMFLAREMRALKVKPDAMTYDRLILVSLLAGPYADAFRYYDEMRHQGFMPRRGTWLHMVRLCGQDKDWRAWWLVEEMKREGWNTARVALWLEGVWPQSERRYREMVREGYVAGREEKEGVVVPSSLDSSRRERGILTGFQSVAASVTEPVASERLRIEPMEEEEREELVMPSKVQGFKWGRGGETGRQSMSAGVAKSALSKPLVNDALTEEEKEEMVVPPSVQGFEQGGAGKTGLQSVGGGVAESAVSKRLVINAKGEEKKEMAVPSSVQGFKRGRGGEHLTQSVGAGVAEPAVSKRLAMKTEKEEDKEKEKEDLVVPSSVQGLKRARARKTRPNSVGTGAAEPAVSKGQTIETEGEGLIVRRLTSTFRTGRDSPRRARLPPGSNKGMK